MLPWGEPDGYLKKVILPGLAKQFGFNLERTVGRADSQHAQDEASLWYGRQRRTRVPTASARKWEGIISNIQRRYDETESDSVRMELEEYMQPRACTTCGGRRLKPESLAVTLADREHRRSRRAADHRMRSRFFENVPVRGNGKPGTRS